LKPRFLLLIVATAFCFWWVLQTPSNDRDWPEGQSRLAEARFEGSRVTIEGVRHFVYRSETDFDARWTSRTIDLDRVQGLDVFVSDWGWRDLVHTIVSWKIEGEAPLAISIESRREVGEPFDPIRGLLRQYELYYVIADERDVIRLRTNVRGEHVHLYQTSTSPDLARRLLVSYLEEVNRLREEPDFYDSLTRNCSTTTRRHLASIGVEDTWDWRVVFNGHIDELLYARGVINTSMPFDALREASDITERARGFRGDEQFPARETSEQSPAGENGRNFAERIREGLPLP